MNNFELQEQIAFFQYIRHPLNIKKYPALALASCSLNGVHLSKLQAAKAKASGMLKGEHDIRLPVPRGGYCGLTIEMKYGKNKPTAEQKWYAQELAKEGHAVRCCWNWSDAWKATKDYLDGNFGENLIGF